MRRSIIGGAESSVRELSFRGTRRPLPDPLRHQILEGVPDLAGLPIVDEAAREAGVRLSAGTAAPT